MKKTKTFNMIIIALMAAIMCVAGPNSIAIPISPVPITLTNLVIYFASYVLAPKNCTISYCLYLLLGLVGLPVFSGYSGGLSKLAGPTGGYLIGFVFTAFVCAFFIWKWSSKIYMHVIGMIIGLSLAYIFGTVWFCIVYETDFIAALSMCVFPYLIGDAVKIIIAAAAGPVIRGRLVKAGLIASV